MSAAYQVFTVSTLVPRAVSGGADAYGAGAEHRAVWHIQRQRDILGWMRGNFCKYLSV